MHNSPRRKRARIQERIAAAFVALGCLTLLATAAGLSPSEDGHGTHHQLGLPPCGFLSVTGHPCATCGMTTAYAHAANADLIEAARIQPAGMLLAVLTAAGFWAAGHVALFGSMLGRQVGRMLGSKALILGGGIIAAAWAYKLWVGVG
ncbi:MAG: DUF2752 domain-containing protein [Planctomycetota bacterium]